MNKMFPAVLMLLVSLSASAQSQFSLGTGFDYSSGKYGGTTSTDILYIPVTAKYESDGLFFKLTVPYISITGTGTTSGVILGIGRIGPPTKTTTTSTATTTNSGLGDVVTSAGYGIYAGDQLAVDLVGNVKFGTADANKGLGTGNNDYSAQLDAYYMIHNTTLFGTAGYKVYGAPAGISLNNAPYGTLGISQKLGSTTSVGTMYDATQSPLASGVGLSEFTVYISQKIKPDLKLQINAMKGYSDASPDHSFGATITGSF